MTVLFLPLILGLVALTVSAAVVSWFVNTDPQRLARALRNGGAVALIGIGAALLLRGRPLIGFALIGAGLNRLGAGAGGGPFGSAGGAGGGVGGGPFGRGPRPGAGPRTGQASRVKTRRLDAALDHDTGDMDATVTSGRHRGARLSALDVADVIAIWRDAQREGDEESQLVLEAYLDRRRADWRDDVQGDGDAGARGASGAGGGSGGLTEQEALELLGLQSGASEGEIRAAHRRLMKAVHPDQGGSDALAARLNAAKDILLRRRR